MLVIIPMAGQGQRFFEAGYDLPKPMIDVGGAPMIQRVLENLDIDGKYYFVVKREHQEKYGISDLLRKLKPNCFILEIDKNTEGAACTVNLLKPYIEDFNDELIITNCDQIFEWDKELFLEQSRETIKGSLLCHLDKDSKWSYCTGIEYDDGTMEVINVLEKPRNIPEPPYANVGLYYFKKCSYYFDSSEKMIRENKRINREFYISPVYNELTPDYIGSVKAFMCHKMWGIGTPDDLKNYLKIAYGS